ncbi:major facilitator superfamily domain-containing protein [Bombardia bombarda]|uniref:Major facilitator superfamily domain-containing protein n=1 Tax=Bombardia bombarda TaxID=252184 RepID=A0AA39XMQ2_9PEZI|nr:major facilitator superfamily domain-containing protein [Bombardia bombarda]
MAREERQPGGAAADEATSLLRRPSLSVRLETSHDEENVGSRENELSPTSTVGFQSSWDEGQWKKNLVLLLGVFLVNSDSAILLALFRQVASDFDSLSSASWIINSYIIGIVVAQPLYGKLSDIYGRKPLLLFAYACYIVGGLLSGIGFSFWGVLIGRAICGIGNGGITVLISTLILTGVDLIPIRDVAVWRGYAYTVNQVGRAIGPSLGGFIADNLNWRWSLLYQVPLNILGLAFIWWKMSFPPPPSKMMENEDGASCQQSKLKRIDFSGSASLGLANVSLLLLLDRIQQNPKNFIADWMAIIPLSTWVSFLVVFILIEAFWAREPILPLRLLANRNVLSAYSIQFLQTAAQMALYTSVPLYFRVTNRDSSSTVAIRLLFITLGTVSGGLISGYVIKRTGLYRFVICVAIVLSNLSFAAIFLRWRGPIGWAETLYGFPIGLAFGVSLSAAFIGLTAGLDPTQVAVSTSGFYLSLNLGSMLGVSSASLMISSFVERTLQERLHDIPNAGEIIHRVTSNFDSINELPSKLAAIVISAYTQSFINVWLFSLVFGCLALVASLVMREGQLEGSITRTKRPSVSSTQNYSTFPRPGWRAR